MSGVLSVEQAEQLAARTLAMIDAAAGRGQYGGYCHTRLHLIVCPNSPQRIEDGRTFAEPIPQPADGGAVPPQPAAVRAHQHGP